MIAEVLYLNSATAIFLNLQSGYARPYWEINITVSGDSSTYSGIIGQAYGTNDIISMGAIDRQKPVRPGELSRLFAGDMVLSLNNASGTYSPLATASIFTDAQGSAMDYLHSVLNVWAGFVNTSGTAYTVQRGSFLLTKLRIDSKDRIAYLSCQDAAKIPLDKTVGNPGISGTSTTWQSLSGSSTKAIMSELLSAVGLTAGQYSLESGINLDYVVTEKKVGNALGELALANDGYVYTNGKGQVIFGTNIPDWAGISGGGSDFTIQESNHTQGLKYYIDVSYLLNRVQVNYGSGTENSRSAEDTNITKGTQEAFDNEAIQQPAIANALASRTLGQFKAYRPYIEFNGVWLPSLEIGQRISVYDTNTFQTAIDYEVYKIRENIADCSMKISAIKDLKLGQKWGFLSDTSAANCGTVFTDSWHSGFLFLANTGSGFDDDGNNDGIIDTGYAASGANTTGIEVPYQLY